jgi:hypothetical protein
MGLSFGDVVKDCVVSGAKLLCVVGGAKLLCAVDGGS